MASDSSVFFGDFKTNCSYKLSGLMYEDDRAVCLRQGLFFYFQRCLHGNLKIACQIWEFLPLHICASPLMNTAVIIQTKNLKIISYPV